MKSLGFMTGAAVNASRKTLPSHADPPKGNLSCSALGISPILLVLCLIVSGCSHSRESEGREFGPTGTFAVEPPTFLTGPMGVLLTNAAGYGAHISLQNESLGAPQGATAGQLFCRGSKLLFAPVSTESKKQQARGGGFAFIWDVSRGSGYVLSGALQAYAPVSTSVHATNVVRDVANATVQMSDGRVVTFQISPGVDAPGVSGRISATGDRMPLIVSLSNIRAEVPPEDVFIPPDDFSKYGSPEAMADELAARQRNLRRKTPSEFEPMQEMHRPDH